MTKETQSHQEDGSTVLSDGKVRGKISLQRSSAFIGMAGTYDRKTAQLKKVYLEEWHYRIYYANRDEEYLFNSDYARGNE